MVVGEKASIGAKGENFAAEYLKRRGYRILSRNERNRFGEIDLVARAGDGTLVFVEVKTMREGELTPEDQMKRRKMDNFRKSAEFFAGRNQEAVDEKKGWRLDLIAITVKGGSRSIKHYENIA